MTRRKYILAIIGAIALTALVERLMGHVLICKCGYIKLWHGVPASSENSQHISDWYTFSHIIHGFLLYWIAWLAGRKLGSPEPSSTSRGWSLGARLLLGTVIECGWEVFENTEFIINRYRETTLSLDYYGDSVLNSTADILVMILGFVLAARLPVWATIALAIGMEVMVAFFIRDNLTLNIIMLLHPFQSVLRWQRGG